MQQNNTPLGAGQESPAFNWELLQTVLARPIAFHPIFARIGGSTNAGLFLSQAFYWHTRGADAETEGGEGWFYKSQREWREETALSDEEQLTARRQLVRRGLIEEKRRGLPARLYFRLKKDAILAAILAVHGAESTSSAPDSGNPGNLIPATPESASRDSPQPDSGNPGNLFAATPETLIGTEITSENTQENTSIEDDDFKSSISEVDVERLASILVSHRLPPDTARYLATHHSERVARVPAWWQTVDKRLVRSEAAAVRSFVTGTGKWTQEHAGTPQRGTNGVTSRATSRATGNSLGQSETLIPEERARIEARRARLVDAALALIPPSLREVETRAAKNALDAYLYVREYWPNELATAERSLSH